MRSGLSEYKIIAFVNVTEAARAKSFYQQKLGLRLVREELPFALVFDANGIMLRLGINEKVAPAQGTVLGWEVPEIGAAVERLEQAGISLECYPFITQDARGIWATPTGAKAAWFKDPDGNVLSVSEHPES